MKSTELVTRHEVALPRRQGVPMSSPSSRIVLRAATPDDASAIHTLIELHLEEGHLLRRSLGELTVHAPRFVVAVDGTDTDRGRGGRVLGCAELAPLSPVVAELRSLVVDRAARATGLGGCLVEHLQHQARFGGFDTLCAFTHDPGFFVRQGFSIVPHVWVPEKIAHDCCLCALFRRCGQHAVMLPLVASDARRRAGVVPLSGLRG